MKSRYRINGELPVPPAFSASQASRVRMATRERAALDALLGHTATLQDLGVLECLVECAIRAVRHARKLSYCSHLDAAMLDECERVMLRGAHALHRAKDRHERSGVYGLDALDRQCVIEVDQWYGAMNERGAIPRAVWLMSYRDAVQKRGAVVLPPWESLQAEVPA